MKNKLYDATEFENIRDILNNAIAKYPSNIAFTIKNKENKEVKYRDITYKEFGDEINYLGTAFLRLGFKGKNVAVISKNRYEWALTYYAVLDGVGRIIPLDKGLPEQEIELSLIRSKADVIVFEESYTDIILNIMKHNKTQLKEYICMDNVEENRFKKMTELLLLGKQEMLNGNNEYLNAEIDNNAISIVLFTSGTTSLAKAVMLSHKNIASNIYALTSAEKIYDTDVNIAFLPFHHTFGSTGLTFFLSCGAKNVFCDGLRHIAQNLKEYKVSVFVCVPLILEAMHKKIMQEIEKQGKTKKVKFAMKISNFLLKFGIDIRRKIFKDVLNNLGGNLRFVVSGAAAIDKNVAKDFNAFGILTVQGYGLTETSPVLCAENAKSIRYGSVGFPVCNVEVKIDNPNEKGIGEVIAKGPNVMAGYYENEEATNETLIDGWFHSGDLGYIDKDGYVFITGRKKNVIVLKNGKNVYPEELEVLINNLTYVEESMVFGMPKDDDLVLSAKIVYNKDYIKDTYPNITKEEVEKIIWEDIKAINKTLTNYKHIKNIIITDEPMIKTTTAKIKRFQEIEAITKNK